MNHLLSLATTISTLRMVNHITTTLFRTYTTYCQKCGKFVNFLYFNYLFYGFIISISHYIERNVG